MVVYYPLVRADQPHGENPSVPFRTPHGLLSRRCPEATNCSAGFQKSSIEWTVQYLQFEMESYTMSEQKPVYRSKMRFIQTSLNFTMSSGFELF